MLADYYAELGQAEQWPDLADSDKVTARYHILVATGHKKDKETGADALREQWAKTRLLRNLDEPDAALWQPIARPEPDLMLLPRCSFSLRFTFTLAQPYLSKDDNAFYIIDNPIVRDKVFRLPLVRPSSWKGNLRSALRQLGHADGAPAIRRLFGEASDAVGEERSRAGRLVFFPTFFTQTSLEIINPHDREKKVGRNPILFESVPPRATGSFTLLYVPFDLVGEEAEETARQLAEDLPLVAEGLQAMFCLYGFSAKRSSGFGLAAERVTDGCLAMHISAEATPPRAQAVLPVAPTQPLPRYLVGPGRLKPEYLNADGTFRERSPAELQTLKTTKRREYDRALKWWRRQQEAPAPPPTPPEPPPPPLLPLVERSFDSFDALVAVASELARLVGRGGAA